jgi:soluble lytic murein transglycosylase-like protein
MRFRDDARPDALLPSTAARLGVQDMLDPAQNIDAGTRYCAIFWRFIRATWS